MINPVTWLIKKSVLLCQTIEFRIFSLSSDNLAQQLCCGLETSKVGNTVSREISKFSGSISSMRLNVPNSTRRYMSIVVKNNAFLNDYGAI
ncbi:hypothetical protein TNCT_103821 [Trichonephila clavata]|uniref:Uncharacterized protein n=1 Tax=Trichonephila clavata TaxID=2740835 RepID=A0A8X6KUR8_TRICU|nr:hypothetical protein TNCT_103821 [Trichonephila clavata]